MSKKDMIEKLYYEYKKEFEGKEIVLGDGNPDSKLFLAGEAPGKDEVKLSKPFVGMAGKNLSEFLDILGWGRESIYITNAIKYRLSKVNEQTGRVVNRPASKEEIKTNRSYLLEEIRIINPSYIVTLGNVPFKSITDDYDVSMGEVHGRLNKVIISDKEYNLFPLYHPASVIYNRSLKSTYIDDIKRLKTILDDANII